MRLVQKKFKWHEQQMKKNEGATEEVPFEKQDVMMVDKDIDLYKMKKFLNLGKEELTETEVME